MASVYKREEDKGRPDAPWYFGYSDYSGTWKTRKGFTDKKKTKQLSESVELREVQRRYGLVDVDQEKLAEHRQEPILAHVDDFRKSLGKRTAKYQKLVVNRVKLVIKTGGFESIADFNIAGVESALSSICEEQGLGHKTFNHYVDACFAFCAWLAKKAKRTAGNPLEGIEKLNAEEDVRHQRRALSPVEFAMLVQSARSSGIPIQCYDGETRARIYITSYLTGLRRSEIASLTASSFDLAAKQPTLTVQAAHSKHRRLDVLPMHPDLVSMVPEWISGLAKDQVLFPKLAKRRTWKMVKLDLERVGIAYRTSDGVADFHAAGRHTHITELLRNGASLVEARELARHSDIKMTMKYTHIGLDDQAKAVGRISTTGLTGEPVSGSDEVARAEQSKSQECHRSAQGTQIGNSWQLMAIWRVGQALT